MEQIRGALITAFLALIASLIAMAVRKPEFYLRTISSVVGWVMAVVALLSLGAAIGANIGLGSWMIWTGAVLVTLVILWLGLMFLAIHVMESQKHESASDPSQRKDNRE